MRFSSILRHLRCGLGCHEWITWLDGFRPQDIPLGYSFRACADCDAKEYAPGYPRS